MEQVSKAEQLKLPEQLYIMLVDPDTGEPLYGKPTVERVLATAVLWELLNCGAIRANGSEISGVESVLFRESYLRNAALMISDMAPADSRALIMEIAAKLHPIWRTIGDDMVNEHLLTPDVRTRFCLFHQRVLSELGEARIEGHDLGESMRQAARATWDQTYEADLVTTHPRLLARIVILDNYGLLAPVIGYTAYSSIKGHLPDLRTHLHDAVRDASAGEMKQVARDRQSTYSGGSDGIYSSGSDFWIGSGDCCYCEEHGGHHHHHEDDDDEDDGSDGDGDASDGGGGDSGGGGGDGGCGGCGGCGG